MKMCKACDVEPRFKDYDFCEACCDDIYLHTEIIEPTEEDIDNMYFQQSKTKYDRYGRKIEEFNPYFDE